MISTSLYLPTVVPQWGIFLGIVLLTIGFVDKNKGLTRIGWVLLISTGLAALYFNLLGSLSSGESASENAALKLFISTGWQSAAGGLLAFASLLFFHFEKKRYTLLSFLTIAYFILIFFLYVQVSEASGKSMKNESKTKQKQVK